ncbi:MAG TPA: xanthine dehydrogenase family protein molybdopterin-binding subunit [Gemmatimonadales bacterium]|nr:xanthine dehydrogenase family protein molybdopterin-binding subunit [Gemmatimonadales bacterium]
MADAPQGTSSISRRDLLKAGLAAGVGLTIAVYLDGCGQAIDADPPRTGAPFAPDAWIRLTPDGIVMVVVDRSEMGQGVTTSLPMLVAEELDADWSMVRFDSAPAGPAYINPLAGDQRTGGSNSVRAAWLPLRTAAAKARAMLVLAAAREWGVPPDQCRTERGRVFHPPTGRSAGYGELATSAGALAEPATVTLKHPRDFRLIGQSLPRLDLPDKVTGRAIFGIDVKVPGMLVAVVERCPVFGGKVRRVDDSAARTVPGVRHVVRIDSGVAVVAVGYWQAMQGRRALRIEWDEGALATTDSAGIRRHFVELATHPGVPAKRRGDVAAGLAGGARRIEAIYELPYLAHATMEPTTCTADVGRDHCTVWVPTQYQSGVRMGDGAREAAARAAGLRPSQVTVHTTLLGGGFGRRVEDAPVREAVQISKTVGAPVKVIWSREDDIRHDHYRPATYHQLHGALDAAGKPAAWQHRIVAPSIMSRFSPGFVPGYIPGWLAQHFPAWTAHHFGPLKHGVDGSAVEGAVRLPYAIPNFEVDYVMAEVGVPVGFWRSVGQSQNVFVTESFIDELAHAGGADPLAFRRDLLRDHPRLAAVLDLAAARAGWASSNGLNQALGVAAAEMYDTALAQIAEVTVEGTTVRVKRVVCAVDCGTVVHPDTAAAQIEGGIVFGLTAALKGEITLAGGRVEQGNFGDYQLLRLPDMPAVEVHFVDSDRPPGGIGEAATPLIAPAVANALFRATGRRVRRLPIRLEGATA